MSDYRKQLEEATSKRNYINELHQAYYNAEGNYSVYEVYELLNEAFSKNDEMAVEFERAGIDVPKERTIYLKLTQGLSKSKLGSIL